MNYKKIIFVFLLAAGITTKNYAYTGSDSLGLPGDNLDLPGVLELFKSSSSLEAFEKELNNQDNEINNLDLDEDGQVDYIRVIDHMENDAHAIVLQVPVSETDAQDVAVIEIEKNGDNSAQLQVVGDEELYGKDYIIEPEGGDGTKSVLFGAPVVVNVWLWAPVKYIYAPKYVVWVSPWKWHVYPGWFKPWKPVAWHVHHVRVVRYHANCHHVTVYRVTKAHKVYGAHRVTSVTVHERRTGRSNAKGPHPQGPGVKKAGNKPHTQNGPGKGKKKGR